jgi:hypothetical protein
MRSVHLERVLDELQLLFAGHIDRNDIKTARDLVELF